MRQSQAVAGRPVGLGPGECRDTRRLRCDEVCGADEGDEDEHQLSPQTAAFTAHMDAVSRLVSATERRRLAGSFSITAASALLAYLISAINGSPLGLNFGSVTAIAASMKCENPAG